MKRENKIFERIFNRWEKWELIESNVRRTKTERNLIGTWDFQGDVIVDIYSRKNKFTGNVKIKYVEK